MSAYFLTNILMMAAGLAFAASHSIEARKAGLAFLAGWLFFIAAWLPDGWNPRDIIYSVSGDKIKSPQLWIASDTILMIYIAILAIRQWWGIVIVLSLAVQIAFHVTRIMDVFDFATYSNILDKIFIVQIAVFLVLGWPNVRDRLRHFVGSKFRPYGLHREGASPIVPKD